MDDIKIEYKHVKEVINDAGAQALELQETMKRKKTFFVNGRGVTNYSKYSNR